MKSRRVRRKYQRRKTRCRGRVCRKRRTRVRHSGGMIKRITDALRFTSAPARSPPGNIRGLRRAHGADIDRIRKSRSSGRTPVRSRRARPRPGRMGHTAPGSPSERGTITRDYHAGTWVEPDYSKQDDLDDNDEYRSEGKETWLQDEHANSGPTAARAEQEARKAKEREARKARYSAPENRQRRRRALGQALIKAV